MELDWLSRPSQIVAPELLGWVISHTTEEGMVSVKITEVEAYAGQGDPASHAYRGRTERNAPMFGPAGRWYIYRSHGLHCCANVTTGPDGEASAVLLRAGHVIEGLELAQARRGEGVAERSLARGPGCLGQALGLTTKDSGTAIDTNELALRPLEDESQVLTYAAGPRVGVSRATEVPWRFWIPGDRTVSIYRARAATREGKGSERKGTAEALVSE